MTLLYTLALYFTPLALAGLLSRYEGGMALLLGALMMLGLLAGVYGG